MTNGIDNDWELVHNGKIYMDTYRMKIYGGWLVREHYRSCLPGDDQCNNTMSLRSHSVAIVFVPDSDHRWENETITHWTLLPESPKDK